LGFFIASILKPFSSITELMTALCR